MMFRKKGGLLIPAKDLARAAGVFRGEIRNKHGDVLDVFEADNTVITEGLIAMMNATFAGGGAVTNWYIALFTNNYTPVATDTASSITGNAGEFSSYSGGTRPAFTPAAATQPTAQMTNSAAKANYTFTGGATLMGAFLVSNATIGANSGTLYSAVNFGARLVSATDTMALTYQTALTSS